MSKEREDGWGSYEVGLSLSQNPHTGAEDHVARSQWSAGWRAAALDLAANATRRRVKGLAPIDEVAVDLAPKGFEDVAVGADVGIAVPDIVAAIVTDFAERAVAVREELAATMLAAGQTPETGWAIREWIEKDGYVLTYHAAAVQIGKS